MSVARDSEKHSDEVPELPGGHAIAGHHVNAILRNPHHRLDDTTIAQPSPSSSNSLGDASSSAATSSPPHHRRRPSSSSAHIPFDFFDKEGVQELKRSLTSQSTILARAAERENVQSSQVTPPAPSSSSQSTAFSGEDTFDLEKHLRNAVSKCVILALLNDSR